jgi:isocitrate/isopropylmalate dehydrogenase
MANPVGAVLSASLMMEALGHEGAAADIERAVKDTLKSGRFRTPDMGGKTSTHAMGDAIVEKLKRK